MDRFTKGTVFWGVVMGVCFLFYLFTGSSVLLGIAVGALIVIIISMIMTIKRGDA